MPKTFLRHRRFRHVACRGPAERAFAEDQTFGPFIVDSTKPDLITLNGLLDAGSALNFRRALQAAPNAKLVTLNSPGGNVQMGLLIADDIHQRKLWFEKEVSWPTAWALTTGSVL